MLVLALVAALVPTSFRPAAAAPIFPTVTTAFTTNTAPVVGSGYKIVGQVFLVLGDGENGAAALPNVDVALERRVGDTDPWTVVAQATTAETVWDDPDTKDVVEKLVMYTFTRVADRTASYRVRFLGTSDGSDAIAVSASDDGEGDPLLVGVQRKMPIALKQPKPSAIYMAGSVKPLYARQRVVVMRKTCENCAWQVFARPLTNAKGAYRVRLSAPRRGAHFFQATARASQGFVKSYSQLAKIKSG